MKNQPLLELYQRHESAIYDITSRCAEEMEGPFLIAPNENYWNSATKVAFVGQETHGWSSKRDISAQMTEYSSFNLGETYYPSPFWNVIRKLEAALTGTAYSSAWLNLNRYDEGGLSPSWANQQILAELDFLLLEELKLITPDVVIFLTGPNYDGRLTALLNPTYLPIQSFPERQLCKVQSPLMAGTMLRTYHPNYLRRSGLEESVIEAIHDTVAGRQQPTA